jgi:hypothetical protein
VGKPVDQVFDFAFESSQRIGENWGIAFAGDPLRTGEAFRTFASIAPRKAVSNMLMMMRKDTDGETAAASQHGQARRALFDADKET